MPSLYTSTTIGAKLKFCDDFFAAHADVTIDNIKQCPPFRKVDMYEHFNKLTIRSLRSRRSSMIAVVEALKARHPLFAELYPIFEAEYLSLHPSKQQRPRHRPPLPPLSPPPKQQRPRLFLSKQHNKREKHHDKQRRHESVKEKHIYTRNVCYSNVAHETTNQILCIDIEKVLAQEYNDLCIEIESLTIALQYANTRSSRMF